MAMSRGVTYVRSRSKPSSWKRLFFFETRPRIALVIETGTPATLLLFFVADIFADIWTRERRIT